MATITTESERVAQKRSASRPEKRSLRAKSLFEAMATGAEKMADIVTIAISFTVARFSYILLHIGKNVRYSEMRIVEGSAIFAFLFVTMLTLDGGYQSGNSLLRIRETERIFRACARSFVVAMVISFCAAQLVSRTMLLIAIILVPTFIAIEKQLLYDLLHSLHSHGHAVRRVIIYGGGTTGRRLFSALVRSPKLGLNPVAIVDDDRRLAGSDLREYSYHHARSAEVLAGPLTADSISRLGADMIIVAIPSVSERRLNEIARLSVAAGTTMAVTPRLSHNSDLIASYIDVDGVLISDLQRPTPKIAYNGTKRIFDIVVTLLLLLPAAPFWLIAVILIRLDSPGPAIFKQSRVGKDGVLFEIFKFRTMRSDAPAYAAHPLEQGDPRITRLGKWLRRTSLDELPQLINVLRGEMSLVGPRPEMPFIVETYGYRDWQRLQVTPGLTGLWQLSADRSFPIHTNLHYDLYYIRNRNFFMDVAVLLHTVLFAMKGV